MSGTIQGKAFFSSWSMNVKIEGKNAVRHMDMATHNHASMPANTPPQTYLDSMNQVEDVKLDEMAILLLDEADQPVVGGAYILKAADGKNLEGLSDGDGMIRVFGIEPGAYEITLTEVEDKSWERI
jgi:hypothetical protein